MSTNYRVLRLYGRLFKSEKDGNLKAGRLIFAFPGFLSLIGLLSKKWNLSSFLFFLFTNWFRYKIVPNIKIKPVASETNIIKSK